MASQKLKNDQSVMATNNSSIVSKRSVEKLYYPEPHFFRHFVKKPQRRAPLINRGYWLRMHTLDVVIGRFLEEVTSARKVVLNLGCGYDPLAFQWLSKLHGKDHNNLFVDVDFPELMKKKTDMIVSTPQLYGILGNDQALEGQHGVHLASDHYYAIGCDLADTKRLDELLSNIVDVPSCLILCTAEVSVTYMDVSAADAVIRWAGQYQNMRFCLLEQYLPDGADHPFAQKMIQHFENLHTPLKNISTYPTLKDQQRRFCRAGWSSVSARSLWHIWHDPEYVTDQQRLELNRVEPFDEWEEFVLFACHYFVLIAENRSAPSDDISVREAVPPESEASQTVEACATFAKDTHPYPGKRFGSVLPSETLGAGIIGHYGGLGSQSRTSTTDLYVPHEYAQGDKDLGQIVPIIRTASCVAEARMCHSATPVLKRCIIAGGRRSPSQALSDCWDVGLHGWSRVEDLPLPLYRHAATSICLTAGGHKRMAVLVYGGKSSTDVMSNKWLLRPELGGEWQELKVSYDGLAPRFGAMLFSDNTNEGILLGGMDAKGRILEDQWRFVLDIEADQWTVRLQRLKTERDCKELANVLKYIHRFGAVAHKSEQLGYLIIGGVCNDLIPQQYEVLRVTGENSNKTTLKVDSLISRLPLPRSLLIGHSVTETLNGTAILGGGAVCFSFGTYWNRDPLILESTYEQGSAKLIPIRDSETQASRIASSISAAPAQQMAMPPVGMHSLTSEADFAAVLRTGTPAVMRGLELGPCVDTWNSLEAVVEKVGAERQVIVHQSTDTYMDFQRKNFEYVKKSFGAFIDEFSRDTKQYLRSLASEQPAEKPANFMNDFPQLSKDFIVPSELKVVEKDMHSSVLRVSGFVNMWLHYDVRVMANVLFQIRGTKRLVLFPPSDVSHLQIPAGSSTSSIDCFKSDILENADLRNVHPYEAMLQPGDVLYIPPLWLHTASPSNGVNISINIFFRSLAAGYAPGRDVYGNRDLQAYEKGRQDIDKIARSFDRLPGDARAFYLQRLADELKEKAHATHQR